MSIPEHPDSNEYYERLCVLRDEALVHSQTVGRISLGRNISFGNGEAEWTNEQGGRAWLQDSGLRIGGFRPGRLWPTRLHLFDPVPTAAETGSTADILTMFQLEIDAAGLVQVYTNVFDRGGPVEIVRRALSRMSEQQHRLENPTDEQYERLYRELERGASGLHPYRPV